MTNARAVAEHRRLDAAQAESMARDGGEYVEHTGALMPPAKRKEDMRTMSRANGKRVLLLKLSERISGAGRQYLSGYFGQARLVGFRAAETDKYGNAVWEIYAAEPEPKPGQGEGRG